MKEDAVIIGYSGHAYVVLEVLMAVGYQVIGYCETQPKQKNPFNIAFLGSEKNRDVVDVIMHEHIFVAVGDNFIRKQITEQLIASGCILPHACHPSAVISPTSSLKEASLIMPGVIVNSLACIGKGVICNSSSVIEHECIIGDYTHIAPGAVLAGNVMIGRGSFVGANSVIKQGVQIGDNVIIGAGSVVTKNVISNSVVYGNPATHK